MLKHKLLAIVITALCFLAWQSRLQEEPSQNLEEFLCYEACEGGYPTQKLSILYASALAKVDTHKPQRRNPLVFKCSVI